MTYNIISSNGSRLINVPLQTLKEVVAEGLEGDETLLITSHRSKLKVFRDLVSITEYVNKDIAP